MEIEHRNFWTDKVENTNSTQLYLFAFFTLIFIILFSWYCALWDMQYKVDSELNMLRDQNCRYRESLDKFTQYGKTSYYADRFHGLKTANGEVFDMHKMTCASNYYPFGTRLKVSTIDKSVHVIVNDRGGFGKYKRILDLSYAAADSLGIIKAGVVDVKIEVE